jgi:hypothetical protein
VEEIWEMLRELACQDMAAEQWDEFRRAIESGAGGDYGSLYRGKVRNPFHWGPHAVLVREVLRNPPAGTYDYLACPEIIQDIALCCTSMHGVDLEARFVSATVPCIVRFRGQASPEAAKTACWYIWSTGRGRFLTDVCWGPTLGGAVPPADIVDIEVG